MNDEDMPNACPTCGAPTTDVVHLLRGWAARIRDRTPFHVIVPLLMQAADSLERSWGVTPEKSEAAKLLDAYDDCARAMVAKIQRLERDLAVTRAALGPFARRAATYSDVTPDHFGVIEKVTVGDCRRASAALNSSLRKERGEP